MELNNKNTYVILFLLILFVFAINLATFKKGHNWFYADFAAYVGQAKSIVEGTVDELNSMNRYRYENSTRITGSLNAPWGFPIVLTPIYYFFGLDILAMKTYVNIFFVFSLWIIFLLFENRLTRFQNLLLISIIAFNTWFFDFKENVISDYPFLFFSLFSLFLIKRFIIEKRMWRSSFFSYSLIGAVIFVSYSIRSVGLVLLPTLLLVQFIENRKGSVLSLVKDKYNFYPYIVFILFTLILRWSFPGGVNTEYFAMLSNKSIQGFIFEMKYYTLLPARFFPFLFLRMNIYSFNYSYISLGIYSLILLAVFIGIIRNLKKDYMYFSYIIFTLPVLMTFSAIQGFRLLIPIFPFFIYFLFSGLSGISSYLSTSDKYSYLRLNAASICGTGLLIISLFYFSQSVYKNIVFNKSNQIEGSYSAETVELFDYIKTHTKKDAGIIFRKPRAMVLFAERQSFSLRSDFTIEQLLNSRAQYIAFGKVSNAYSLTAQDLRDKLNCLFENKTFILCSLQDNTDKT